MFALDRRIWTSRRRLMENHDIEYFRKKLLEARKQILNGNVLNDFDDLQVKSEELADEADLANSAINQQISFSIREKEMEKLRKIEAALGRIEEGVFGFCIESGDEISRRRLETQPWAEYSIEVAEEKEREQRKRA